MIQIYGAPPTRGLRVVWMLEELGLDYEIMPFDFMKRYEDPDFVAMNPAGFVPVIHNTDDNVTMFESGAILQYLGDKYGKAPLYPQVGDANYPAYLQFLHFGEASLAAVLNVTIGSKFFGPPEEADNFGARLAVDMVVRRTRALVPPLKRHPYIAGDDFTAADISVAYALGMGGFLGYADKLDPVLQEYLAHVTARPAYKRAAAKAKPAIA